MPTLTWVGKDKVVNHHLDVPFRVLQRENHFDALDGSPANSTDNRIIHGDNLAALKSLLPEFEGKINCIYIDPPYNTGNESWVYNDAVNDPKIKKWLGQVVGKEGEDLSRHDKWLCMMYPRLKLLHRLLAKDGVIFISIDDWEAGTLRLVLDEIFGTNNFVANIVWQKRTSPDSRLRLGDAHEHIFCYGKDKKLIVLNKIPQSEKQLSNFKNPDNDPRGAWVSTDFSAQGHRPNQMYKITTPSGREVFPPSGNCWKNIESVFLELVADNRIWFGKEGNGVPRRKTYLHESEGVSAWTWWSNGDVGHSQEAKSEIKDILSDCEDVFDTPKPTRLIERILQIATNKDALILDSFAGSGTTAHAVLKLNAQDQGNRRFILIEMEDYADTITAERVRRVMSGYGEGNKQTAGLGGGFDYYTVGAAIFNPDDTLNEAVGVDVIRDYVSYSEGIATEYRTPQNKPDGMTASPSKDWQSCSYTPYLLGLSPETAWIFYYEADAVTCLDLDFLGTLKFGANKPATAIIYADKCLFNKEFLTKHGLIFKKIPRDITRF